MNSFMICNGVGFFGFILFGTFYASWTCMFIFFAMLGKFSVILFMQILAVSQISQGIT